MILKKTVFVLRQDNLSAKQISRPSDVSDASTDINNAMNVMNAIKNLGDTIKFSSEVFNIADKIMPAMEMFGAVDPVIAVAGVVFSLVEIFLPSQQSVMLQYLQQISKQISYLQADMDEYFQKVMQEVEMESCFSRYAEQENVLLTASKKLQLFYEHRGTVEEKAYRQLFFDECANAKCDDAVSMLLSAIDGDPGLFGCDILQILYEGDPTQQFVQDFENLLVDGPAFGVMVWAIEDSPCLDDAQAVNSNSTFVEVL